MMQKIFYLTAESGFVYCNNSTHQHYIKGMLFVRCTGLETTSLQYSSVINV